VAGIGGCVQASLGDVQRARRGTRVRLEPKGTAQVVPYCVTVSVAHWKYLQVVKRGGSTRRYLGVLSGTDGGDG
jgi:hypothetical protein